MSIMLNTQDYCDECEAFSPEVTVTKYQELGNWDQKIDTLINCEHAKKCIRMYQHAKKFVEKEYEAKYGKLN